MEKGFDGFISFKNTDKNGERTQDSFMGEEPPIVEKIRQFIAGVKEVLSN